MLETSDPYTYPVTDVLRNIPGIHKCSREQMRTASQESFLTGENRGFAGLVHVCIR